MSETACVRRVIKVMGMHDDDESIKVSNPWP
jgi:hypothetical protein